MALNQGEKKPHGLGAAGFATRYAPRCRAACFESCQTLGLLREAEVGVHSAYNDFAVSSCCQELDALVVRIFEAFNNGKHLHAIVEIAHDNPIVHRVNLLSANLRSQSRDNSLNPFIAFQRQGNGLFWPKLLSVRLSSFWSGRTNAQNTWQLPVKIAAV